MTTTRFTKEQLIKRLEEQESSARYALGFVQDSQILRDIEMDLRINEIALASLTAEPVGTFKKGPCGYHPSFHEDAVPLYIAPPAPVLSSLDPVTFDDLRDAVAEVTGGQAMQWSDIYKGHQAVPFINFNSLARIVDKFRAAPQPQSREVTGD